MLRMQFAGMNAEHAAVRAREHGEWQREDFDAEGCRRVPAAVLADQDRVVELHLLGERQNGLSLVDGDADDLELRTSRLEFLEHRYFAQARPAPRRPEVDQQGLAGPARDR